MYHHLKAGTRPSSKQPAAAAAVAGNGDNGAGQEFEYDVVVIGGGSGGVRTARTAAQHGEQLQYDWMYTRSKTRMHSTAYLYS